MQKKTRTDFFPTTLEKTRNLEQNESRQSHSILLNLSNTEIRRYFPPSWRGRVSESPTTSLRKSPGTLVLVRHGQSQWNLENRFTGWVDVDLTDLGREEARRAGEHLKGMTFSHAFTSHLKRAQETLRIILDTGGLGNVPVTQSSALNERHYGDLQGLNKDETAKKYGAEQVHIWRRSYDISPPGGESLKTTAERSFPTLKEVSFPRSWKGKTFWSWPTGTASGPSSWFLKN